MIFFSKIPLKNKFINKHISVNSADVVFVIETLPLTRLNKHFKGNNSLKGVNNFLPQETLYMYEIFLRKIYFYKRLRNIYHFI